MATGMWNPNAIVLVSSNINVGTTAVPLKSSSQLSVKFTIVAPPGNKMYVGDSSVTATKGIIVPAASSITFGPEEIIGAHQKVSYDLGGMYIICTATSQVATLLIYEKSGSSTSPW